MNFLSVVSLIFWVYLVISLLCRAPLSRPKKWALSLCLLAISQKFTFFQFFGVSAFNPSLPSTVMVLWECLYNVFLCLLCLAVIKDCGLLVYWGLHRFGLVLSSPLSSWQLKKALVVFALILSPWGVYCALRVPGVHRVEVEIAGLPTAFDGYRIVQLTDLHIGQLLKRSWLEEVVKKTNALKADLIVLTGDLVEGSPQVLGDEVASYRDLQAKDGVMGVTGNHEHYHGGRRWLERFDELNVRMLENRHVVIKREDATLVMAGLADPAAVRFGLPGPDIKTALQGAPASTVILLSHQPKAGGRGNPVDLQLSGHTHGGLIKVAYPLVGLFNGGMVDGLYKLDDRTQVYVSPGTGLWTSMSCRLGVSSEITEITLRTLRQQ